MSLTDRTEDATASAPSIQSLADQRLALREMGRRRTYLRMAWHNFYHNKLAMVGLVVVVIMVLIALGAGLISTYVTKHEPQEQNLLNSFAPVFSEGHILGTDNLGRDTATRLVYGARVSLGVAALAVLLAVTIGVTIGLVSGFYGRWIDTTLMRFVDVMLSIPTLFLLLLIATMWQLGPQTLALVIAAVAWVTLSRLVRGEVMSIKNREYVEAARVVGAGNRRIITHHILPNVISVIIVWASLTIPALILVEASLSYLGFGVQPPIASWGNMLSGAQQFWAHSAAMVLLPGIAIYITVFAINLMGNGLRDALDPRIVETK